MRNRLAIIGAVIGLALVGGLPAGASANRSAVAAKTCTSSYVNGTIGGQHKCLRRGEFCARRYASQYRRYGFSCTRRDARGNYHLT
jgi:hypothetical protein